MKSKKKAPVERALLVILILSVLELVFFIVLKAETYRYVNSFINTFSRTLIGQYEYIINIFNNLTLAYIMSYIFYIVVLIPERKKQQSINKYVSIYLARIETLLDEIVQVSGDFKNTEVKQLADSPNLSLVSRTDTGRVEFLTYREHFAGFYKKFIDEYQHLAHYIAFIDADLRDCLYEIVTCEFLSKINDLLVNSCTKEFDEAFVNNFSDSTIQELSIRLKQLY